MFKFTPELVKITYHGRHLSTQKELGLGYCGIGPISLHKEELKKSPNITIKRWIKEGLTNYPTSEYVIVFEEDGLYLKLDHPYVTTYKKTPFLFDAYMSIKKSEVKKLIKQCEVEEPYHIVEICLKSVSK